MHLTDNQTKVRDVLPADATATPADVAEATGLAYSTVTRLLRELAEIGAAVKGSEGWRHADLVTATEATDETATDAAPTDATADAEPPEPAESDPVTTDEPDETEAEVERGEPDDTDDLQPHDLTGHAEEADDPADEHEPEPGEDNMPVQVDDTDRSAPDATVEVAGDGDTTEQEDAAADTPTPRQPRLGKGQLQDRVLDALRAATEPLGPTQLSKVLDGRSQGAISNACDRLIERGDAILANEKPRRFEATRTT